MKRLAHFSEIGFLCLFISFNSFSFDWNFYVKKNDLKNIISGIGIWHWIILFIMVLLTGYNQLHSN